MTDTASEEQMLLVVHKHWASLLGEAFLTIVPGFAVLVLLFFFRGASLTMADAAVHGVVTLLVPLCFLILWTILAIQWTNYYLDMLIVTDRQIYYAMQESFMRRFIRQWSIQNVNHVTVHFDNFFESFFNYGSLEIGSREESGPTLIPGIPDPEYVSAVILKQDDRYGQLKETAEKQQELLKFVSHEVKGHLAKSKAAFAAIVEGDYGAVSDPLSSMAHQALADSQKGVETVMSILNDSAAKEGTIRFERKPFDLSATVRRAVEEFRPQAEHKGLAMRSTIEQFCAIVGDERKVEQHVIRNLIDNAIHYTPAGYIEVTLRKAGGMARLGVGDSGIGLAQSDIDMLFMQGRHGEHSKEINPDSTGYGLFVARQVVNGHGGRIWARSSGPGTGTNLFVEFPLGGV